MAISVGDKIPAGKFRNRTSEGNKEITTDELFAGKKVVLFAVPGAFTPTCSETHLPGFVVGCDEIRAKGVDTVACTSVNDHFVLASWAKVTGAQDHILMLADGNGDFASSIGLTQDLKAIGLGQPLETLRDDRRRWHRHLPRRRGRQRRRRIERRHRDGPAGRESRAGPGRQRRCRPVGRRMIDVPRVLRIPRVALQHHARPAFPLLQQAPPRGLRPPALRHPRTQGFHPAHRRGGRRQNHPLPGPARRPRPALPHRPAAQSQPFAPPAAALDPARSWAFPTAATTACAASKSSTTSCSRSWRPTATWC